MIMRCPSCGRDLPETAKFCGFCGVAIAASEETPGTETASRKRSSPIVWLLILALLVCGGVIALLLSGRNSGAPARADEEGIESDLLGSWYSEGSGKLQFTLYSDGTFETQYDEGWWSVVNGNILKLTSLAESETATIVSISGGCLTLSEGSYSIRLWNSAQRAMNAG